MHRGRYDFQKAPPDIIVIEKMIEQAVEQAVEKTPKKLTLKERFLKSIGR